MTTLIDEISAKLEEAIKKNASRSYRFFGGDSDSLLLSELCDQLNLGNAMSTDELLENIALIEKLQICKNQNNKTISFAGLLDENGRRTLDALNPQLPDAMFKKVFNKELSANPTIVTLLMEVHETLLACYERSYTDSHGKFPAA